MPVSFERKFFRSGGSLVIAFPPPLLKGLGIKEGDKVIIEYAGNDKIILIVRRD